MCKINLGGIKMFKKISGMALIMVLLISAFSSQVYAAEPVESYNLEKLSMTNTDVQQCYNIGTEMLASYYTAETCGTAVNLDSYFSAPMLTTYTAEKVNTKRMIVEDNKDNITQLSTDFTLNDYKVFDDYIYCQINARIEYRDNSIVGNNKISGYGEPVKMLFIKTINGYKIADWYTDSPLSYDQINRTTALSIDDPDIWLKSSSMSILNNCEAYKNEIEGWIQAPDVSAAHFDNDNLPMTTATTRYSFNRDAMVTYALTNCSAPNPVRGSSQVPEYKDFSTINPGVS